MQSILSKINRYEKIVEILCENYGVSKEKLFKILKDQDCKYMLFLLLRKYKCTDFEKLSEDFHIDGKRSIKSSLKKAEEKFFINREFRERYFETEEMINKII